MRRQTLGLVLSLVGAVLFAQDPDGPKADAPRPDAEFWGKAEWQKPTAAAQLVAAREPFAAAAMRLKGFKELVWGESLIQAELTVPDLDRRLLGMIKDGRSLPRVTGLPADDSRPEFEQAIKDLSPEDRAAYVLYSDALANAHAGTLDSFKKASRDNGEIGFPQLWTTPDAHRGKVIPITGRLVMVRRWEPTRLAKQRGVKDLYEGWVFGPTRRSAPFCVVFPVLPEGLEVAEQMDRRVTFYGYFLTKFKYRSGEGDRVSPLLIGPTLVLEERPVDPERTTPFALVILGIVMGLLVILTLLFLVINAWFRRGDERVKSTIDTIQTRNNPPLFENELPPTDMPKTDLSDPNSPERN